MNTPLILSIARINRIRLEFKEFSYENGHLVRKVLIESDWNLKIERRPYGHDSFSINRIRLEFKDQIHHPGQHLSSVLIESDWNLKRYPLTGSDGSAPY